MSRSAADIFCFPIVDRPVAFLLHIHQFHNGIVYAAVQELQFNGV
jgi:hypothetical protein